MAKKYFWLKLKDDFFNQKEIKMLRRIAGGDTHTIIYLKMLLLSLSNDGRIYYDGIATNMIEEIALEIDEEVENVTITFNYLQAKGLIAFNTDDEIEMSSIHQMIGSESASAARVRKHREQKALQSNTEVTKVKRLSNTEIEIEKELDIEIEKDILSSKHDTAPYSKIIHYLNDQTGKKYKVTDKWKKLIQARMNEGQTYDDFIKVIDTKVKQWKNDAKMNQYLRPQTLFGNKFDEYLNEYVQPVNSNREQEFEETQRKLREAYEQ